MRRIGLGAIVAAGLATAVLDVLLCVSLLGEVMRAEGAGFPAWAAVLAASACFLASVAVVLLHCASDWGWCRPGWAFGLLYLLIVVEGLGDRDGSYGSSTPLIVVCAYLTTIPFQLAVWARRVAARPAGAGRDTATARPAWSVRSALSARPFRPEPERPVRWPVRVQQMRQVFSLPSEDAADQQSRSAARTEESPSVRGWNSAANRR